VSDADATHLRVVPPEGAVSFLVAGQPVPQPRARVTVRGSFAHAYVPSRHPIHVWRAMVEAACRGCSSGCLAGPVAVCVELRVERPKGHWTTRGTLSAAGRRAGEPPGDWDNYAKAIQDAIVDTRVIGDDRQVVGPNAIVKRWAEPHEAPGAVVWIAPAREVWCTWGRLEADRVALAESA